MICLGSKKLKKMGYHGLVKAIDRYYGFSNFREEFRERIGIENQENKLESLLEDYCQ